MGALTSSLGVESSYSFTEVRVGCGIPEVSAAICTKDRPDLLRRAMRSLIPQEAPPREVLVVDNAPTKDSTLQLVKRESPTVRHFREPKAGLDFARNRAIQEAKGGIIAFLDDDAVAESGWVAATQAVFATDPRLGACIGRVDALGLGTEGERFFEANGGFARGEEKIRLPPTAPVPLSARRSLHGRSAWTAAAVWRCVESSSSNGVSCRLICKDCSLMAMSLIRFVKRCGLRIL